MPEGRPVFWFKCEGIGGIPVASKAVKKTRVVCISHKEDMDGIGSASLVRQATGAEVILVDYVGQMDALRSVAADLTLKSLHICDLGTSKANEEEFVEILLGLRKRHVRVMYIDHHDLAEDTLDALASAGVKIVHNVDECTAVQAHQTFKRRLPVDSSFIAACSAITDYMDGPEHPAAHRLLQMYDRQFVMISATVMTYNIVGHQKDPDYLQYLVDCLTSLKFPHEIPDSFEHARLQVERLAGVMAKVKAGYRKMRNLAHMEITDAGASGAVNFVLGLSGKDVGVAYKERTDYGNYAVSIRGSSECDAHLGRIVNRLSSSMGGSGGGHSRACGALIPKSKIKAFLRDLNRELEGLV